MPAVATQADTESWTVAVRRASWRYGLSSLGPVSVSAAHFIASLLFLRLLKPVAFGQFSFLLIVVPFCLSATGALLGAPASMTRGKAEAVAETELLILQKASLIVSLIAGFAVAALMFSSGAARDTALLFGLYGAAYTLRSFARSYANVHGRVGQVAASDVFYAVLLVAGFLALAVSGSFSLHNAALVLVFAAAAAQLPFGADYLFDLVRAVKQPLFRAYRPMWHDVTRWSLLGVVLTEIAANAHAYLVTFISGPGAFGLLALGALFMRPATLVLGALPDIDQPVMTKRIAQCDLKGAFRVVKEFRTAAMAILAATIILSIVLVTWFPHLLLKHYAVGDAAVVLAFWAGITALRALRTPEAVFVQATGNYATLARISGISGAVALVLTLVLLLAFGPLASLGGILAGEIVMVWMIYPVTNRWRRRIA
jgi:O-antigen/teichoic acid export membrane protein